MPDFADFRGLLGARHTLIGEALTGVTSGACTASVGGIQVTVRVVAGLVIAAGDQVLIVRHGSVYWAVAVTVAAPAVPPPPPPTQNEPTPDSGDPAPAPKPTVTTGTLVCTPVTTSTWRDGKWRTDIGSSTSADTFQGRYGGSSFGRNHGFAFYGSKPRSIAGATVTKATLRARRLTGGDYAARTPTLRLVTQATRPSGFPTLNETASGPSLAVGSTTSDFVIPDAWAQAMVDGNRGGLAISLAADSPYIRFAGRGSWSAAWTLTIHWRRSS
ncbi:hypothetical protein ACFVP3_23665 [Streptomyces sp. NPDC057806]|uniref:hypothetical protein n=1 Tax=Streptomyces sp. NPDC057806 TaxID=3346255 RepID=UPI00369C5DAD